MLNLYLEGYGLKNMGLRLSLSKAYTIPLQINLVAWVYDPSVNQTAESYFTTKVNKKSKAVRDKTGWQSQIQWCELRVVSSKHEDLISCLQTTEKRMEYTL